MPAPAKDKKESLLPGQRVIQDFTFHERHFLDDRNVEEQRRLVLPTTLEVSGLAKPIAIESVSLLDDSYPNPNWSLSPLYIASEYIPPDATDVKLGDTNVPLDEPRLKHVSKVLLIAMPESGFNVYLWRNAQQSAHYGK